jgi:hypothetical protein
MTEHAMTRDELVADLVRIGEKEMTGEDEADVDAYFAPDFRFHGPDGRELDYNRLTEYFTALRAPSTTSPSHAASSPSRASTSPAKQQSPGTFAREVTHSPVGRLPPTGDRVIFELTNIFRYDDQGRRAEEWIQTGNRSLLRQLGAAGR